MNAHNNDAQAQLDEQREQYIDSLNKYGALREQAIKAVGDPDLSRFEDEVRLLAIKASTKTAVVTAYSCEGITNDAEMLMNCPSKLNTNNPEGRTASGTIPTVGRTIACPAHMMGAVLDIEGLGSSRVCEDTGGAIVGNRIDLYVEDIPTAYRFGVRYLNYVIK